MNYSGLQPRWFLEKIERFHFSSPTTRFQWWYFDVLLKDGTILIVALIPQQWWHSEITSSDATKSTLFVTLRTPSGEIQKWTITRPQSDLVRTDRHLALSDIFTLTKKNHEYHASLRLDGIEGSFRVQASVKPFAASEFGTIPMWLLYLFSIKRAPISYVSLVPRDRAWLDLKTKYSTIQREGIAYHEQGRFEGTAHDLPRDGWIWFHIFGAEWGAFGAENAYICIQREGVQIRHGYPMRKETFAISQKQYWQKDNRVLQAAVLDFKTPEISLSAVFEPSDEENLIHYSATDNKQLWSTRRCDARVHIEYKGRTFDFIAPALLETCHCM